MDAAAGRCSWLVQTLCCTMVFPPSLHGALAALSLHLAHTSPPAPPPRRPPVHGHAAVWAQRYGGAGAGHKRAHLPQSLRLQRQHQHGQRGGAGAGHLPHHQRGGKKGAPAGGVGGAGSQGLVGCESARRSLCVFALQSGWAAAQRLQRRRGGARCSALMLPWRGRKSTADSHPASARAACSCRRRIGRSCGSSCWRRWRAAPAAPSPPSLGRWQRPTPAALGAPAARPPATRLPSTAPLVPTLPPAAACCLPASPCQNAAAAPLPHLRLSPPVVRRCFRRSLTSAGDPDALETAAGEMAAAAAALVSIERAMLQISGNGGDSAALMAAKQVGRLRLFVCTCVLVDRQVCKLKPRQLRLPLSLPHLPERRARRLTCPLFCRPSVQRPPPCWSAAWQPWRRCLQVRCWGQRHASSLGGCSGGRPSGAVAAAWQRHAAAFPVPLWMPF